ncbi:hypothetical protein M426DRAFT_221528 [Hypoxylon sp. CI-4A]|nr:hypothetical protein M426DRAFT_221528 [Hypoxylon sp. CI-4A]
MVRQDELSDIDLSIRFKHGIHTILLFVDPTSSFVDIADELLGILRERYPKGLTGSTASSEKTQPPSDPEQVEFAIPKSATDLSQGWTPLDVGKKVTPVSQGIKNNDIVAFAFRPDDEDEDYEVEFEVDYPRFDDDEE